MKTEEEIISRIIETSRKIALAQNRKDNLQDIPIEDKEEVIKKHHEQMLDLDFEINSLGTELNVLEWLFKESEEE